MKHLSRGGLNPAQKRGKDKTGLINPRRRRHYGFYTSSEKIPGPPSIDQITGWLLHLIRGYKEFSKRDLVAKYEKDFDRYEDLEDKHLTRALTLLATRGDLSVKVSMSRCKCHQGGEIYTDNRPNNGKDEFGRFYLPSSKQAAKDAEKRLRRFSGSGECPRCGGPMPGKGRHKRSERHTQEICDLQMISWVNNR